MAHRKGHRQRYRERLLGTEVDRHLNESGESLRSLARRIRRGVSTVDSWRVGRTLPVARQDIAGLSKGIGATVDTLTQLIAIDRALHALGAVDLADSTYSKIVRLLKREIGDPR